jgi:hypothetical protein
MTITIEIPPETEAVLLAQAASRGLSLDAFVRSILALQATTASVPAAKIEEKDIDQMIDEVFDTVPLPSGVGEGAMRRENWY